MINRDKKKIGDLLVEMKYLSEDQLQIALAMQRESGDRLGNILIEKGFVRETEMIEVLEFQLGVPHVKLSNFYIVPKTARLIQGDLAKRHIMIPIKEEKGIITLAMADPLDVYAIDDVKIYTGLQVNSVIASKRDILKAIENYYSTEVSNRAMEEFYSERALRGSPNIDDFAMENVENATVVKLVHELIKRAVRMNASDIHVEIYEEDLRIRFRIDGELQEIMSPPVDVHSAIISRIKIMAKLDIAEKRLPQDGRIELIVDNHDVDMRISILPTVHGEKAVIRILDRSNFLMTKERLGFTKANLAEFESLIKNPHGIILITGPTGSGKTTTLYSALTEINKVNRNIVTVENPVEYRLKGINQVQVNTKSGLDFANGLRSILRQDPDIIMIGEIRDLETAEIAVRSSITGHLVLSTIHTNDTTSTINRLLDMGIENYLLSASIVGIISQRLIKKICNYCKTDKVANEYEQKILELSEGESIYKGSGCPRCNMTGYSGRQAIYEMLSVTDEIRVLIDEKASASKLRKHAIDLGMIPLRESCKKLVIAGVTTVEELNRVAYK